MYKIGLHQPNFPVTVLTAPEIVVLLFQVINLFILSFHFSFDSSKSYRVHYMVESQFQQYSTLIITKPIEIESVTIINPLLFQ